MTFDRTTFINKASKTRPAVVKEKILKAFFFQNWFLRHFKRTFSWFVMQVFHSTKKKSWQQTSPVTKAKDNRW